MTDIHNQPFFKLTIMIHISFSFIHMFLTQKKHILVVVTSFVMISFGDDYIQSWYFIQHVSISSKLSHHPLDVIFWHKLVIDRRERTGNKKILQISKPMDRAHIFSKSKKLMKVSFCNIFLVFTRTKTISITLDKIQKSHNYPI